MTHTYLLTQHLAADVPSATARGQMQAFPAVPRQGQSLHVPQPVPDVVPVPSHPDLPGETPESPPPEMPPNAIPPEIIEPELPGEHSPVRDPIVPGGQPKRWTRPSRTAHPMPGRSRPVGMLRA